LEALNELVDVGKVVHIACSNYSAAQIDEAVRIAETQGWVGPCAFQGHWNLLVREVEEEIVPAVRRRGMGFVPYFPLESGLLTGKYEADKEFPAGSRLAVMDRFAARATPETFAYLGELSRFAADRGHSLLELAFAWLASQDVVGSIIAGATAPEQIAANVAAGNVWRLAGEELEEVPRPPGNSGLDS
jgi:aryl-alcohol dehydrogenase-like predicted oxidoreductase